MPTPRRWFRFSLRTLFVLLTVFGVWLGVQVKWIRDRHAALAWIATSGYSWVVPYGFSAEDFVAKPAPDDPCYTRAPWSIRMLHESGIARIRIYRSESGETFDYQSVDEKLRELKRLFPEADIAAKPLTDELKEFRAKRP